MAPWMRWHDTIRKLHLEVNYLIYISSINPKLEIGAIIITTILWMRKPQYRELK